MRFHGFMPYQYECKNVVLTFTSGVVIPNKHLKTRYDQKTYLIKKLMIRAKRITHINYMMPKSYLKGNFLTNICK